MPVRAAWAATLISIVLGLPANGFPCEGFDIISAAKNDRMPFIKDVKISDPPITEQTDFAACHLFSGNSDITRSFQNRELMWFRWSHDKIGESAPSDYSFALNVHTHGDFRFYSQEPEGHGAFNDCTWCAPMIDGGDDYMRRNGFPSDHVRIRACRQLSQQCNYSPGLDPTDRL
jgi:hypothetical protein